MRDDVAVGRQVRDLRVSRNLRQSDVAERAAVSREVVSRLERGQLAGLTVEKLRLISRALGAPPIVTLGWRTPELDRCRDRLHASLVEATCRLLRTHGWVLAAEFGFNHYGERGAADIIAWHPGLRALLIVKVKTRLWDLQDLFSSTDRKRRLLPAEVRSRFGWDPKQVGLLLVMPDLSTHRHVVARHRATFEAAFPMRQVEARQWLADPAQDLRGLLFLPISQLDDIGPRSLRVRARRVPRKGPKGQRMAPSGAIRANRRPETARLEAAGRGKRGGDPPNVVQA